MPTLGITDFWTYVLGVVFVILLPGPNSLFVLATSAQRGVATGYRAACGVFLGDAVLMLLSALGVASLLKAEPMLFIGLKYLGAAYLFLSRRRHAAGRLAQAAQSRSDGGAGRTGGCPPAVPQGAAAQPVESQGDPVLHLLLHPVRRSRLCLSGPVVPGAGR
ncbi:leucine export protein LeuE [Pseudomonas aeruginosa]|nr:leucine export protein LeuE [Pseudomonas aeruginosa]